MNDCVRGTETFADVGLGLMGGMVLVLCGVGLKRYRQPSMVHQFVWSFLIIPLDGARSFYLPFDLASPRIRIAPIGGRREILCGEAFIPNAIRLLWFLAYMNTLVYAVDFAPS